MQDGLYFAKCSYGSLESTVLPIDDEKFPVWNLPLLESPNKHFFISKNCCPHWIAYGMFFPDWYMTILEIIVDRCQVDRVSVSGDVHQIGVDADYETVATLSGPFHASVKCRAWALNVKYEYTMITRMRLDANMMILKNLNE